MLRGRSRQRTIYVDLANMTLIAPISGALDEFGGHAWNLWIICAERLPEAQLCFGIDERPRGSILRITVFINISTIRGGTSLIIPSTENVIVRRFRHHLSPFHICRVPVKARHLIRNWAPGLFRFMSPTDCHQNTLYIQPKIIYNPSIPLFQLMPLRTRVVSCVSWRYSLSGVNPKPVRYLAKGLLLTSEPVSFLNRLQSSSKTRKSAVHPVRSMCFASQSRTSAISKFWKKNRLRSCQSPLRNEH